MTTIKITELANIGSDLASSTVVPVVNMAGTPVTQKTNVGSIANIILEGAGVDYPEATVALLAQTVSNAAQPNITSVGTLTNVAVSGNATINGNITSNGTAYVGNLSTTGLASITTLDIGTTANLGAVGNVTITGGNNGEVLSTDGDGNLSWTTVSAGANTGNVTFDDINIIGTGNLNLQPDPANASSYLDIFISSGPDIHIVASQSANLILGKDDQSNVMTSWDGGVYVQSWDTGTGNVGGIWAFGGDGTTTFPTANVDLHNGGVQSGEVLQFGNPNLQSIITGPTPSANVNAQRIIIQGQSGNGQNSEGGDVYLWAGDAQINGGDIKIYAGDADNASAGSGGYINLAGGDGFDNGGDITLNGGYSANGYGGQISITGGQGQIDGGPASITGGYATAGNGGAVNITGGTSSVGPSAYGNVEIGSGIYGWSFNNEGNLVLPGNTFAVNYANGTAVTIPTVGNIATIDLTGSNTNVLYGNGVFAAVAGGGAAGNAGDIQINVAGNIGADSTLRYVDNGGEMTLYADYLNAPGIFTSDIYAGNGTPSNITLTTNIGNATWTLDTTGNLSLPEGGSIYSEGFTPSGNPGNTITLNPHGSGSTTNQKLLVYPTAGDGDHIHLTSGNLYQTELFLGSDNLFVKLANTGNIIINSDDDAGNTAQWKFGIDGNLTASGNLIIAGNTNVFGTDAALIQSTDDKPLIALSSGANGAIATSWVEDIGNIGTSNIAAVYANPIPGSKIIRIAVGENGGPGPNLWDFNANGTTTFPGDLIGNGASPAPSINNFNSISSLTLSASGNITGGNIIGNGNTLSNVAIKTSGSWTLASGVNTVNISVPLNGTYAIWINGNIPNGIVTYTATAVVTNTNVPVLGEQYAWYYAVGNALVFTSIPDQFVGTAGSISNVNTYAGNTANVFTFGITNNSGNTAVVNYGYTKL